MNTVVEIDWEIEKERFTQVAYPFARRAAQRAFKRWPEHKQADAVQEFLAKMWDSWRRLLERGRDPEPLLWSQIHWAKQWVRYDRRLAGRPRNLDIQDYRTGMVGHLLDGRGRVEPHDRSARINGFLDWTGQARTDEPAALVEALETAGMTFEQYFAA
jgi:hypothetical protein